MSPLTFGGDVSAAGCGLDVAAGMITLARMSSMTLPIPAPRAWQPDLAGEYPGQQRFLEVGVPPVHLVFCWCPPTPPGRPFVMGSPPDELDRDNDEKQREVNFPRGFWLAQHPVNQLQWKAVMGSDPSQRGKGDMHPVDSVSWNDAQVFCRKVGLRLPKEEEWEYACRAGTTTPVGIGEGQCLNTQRANFDGNHPYGSGRESFKWLDRERTLPQGGFPPNAWGLHDMHGQLWDWCDDAYSSEARVLRGGAWLFHGRVVRSAYHFGDDPEVRDGLIGFRPCSSSVIGQSQAGGRQSAAEGSKE